MTSPERRALNSFRSAIAGMIAAGYLPFIIDRICQDEVDALLREAHAAPEGDDDDTGPEDEVICQLCGEDAGRPPAVGPWRCPSCGCPVNPF